jgi:hypothetical protein
MLEKVHCHKNDRCPRSERVIDVLPYRGYHLSYINFSNKGKERKKRVKLNYYFAPTGNLTASPFQLQGRRRP